MDQDLVKMMTDLGGTLGALGFSGWLIVFLLKEHRSERDAWMQKDTENDRQLQDLVRANAERSGKMQESITLLTEVLRRIETRLPNE